MSKYLLDELEDKIIDTVSSYLEKNNLEDQRYSILLSGGFDSGLLAALTKPSMSFRVKFPYGLKFDESRYAEAINKHLNLQHEEIVITPKLYQENFEQAVRVYGEVTPHFSLVPLYILFKGLKDRGETDVLSGEGPDEYLGGYARQIIFDELRKLYEIPELRNYHKFIGKVLEYPDGHISNLIDAYALLVGYSNVNGDVEKYIRMYEDGRYPLQGAIGKMDMELGQIEKMEQKFAKHFGINFHYPYINDEFAEYCYKLPDDMKIKDGRTKVAFKEIAMKYLPEIMRDRNKMGGPVAPVNQLMGWNLPDFDKSKYIEAQKEILK